MRKDLTSLVEDIKDWKVSSEKVILAYIFRIATIGKEFYLIATIYFEDAIIKAKKVDETINIKLKSGLPPFIGVPASRMISLQSQMCLLL